jgi:hypothetical protein
MKKLLAENGTWNNREFATAIFLTLLVEFYNTKGQVDKVAATGKVLQGQLDDLLRRADDTKGTIPEVKPLLGSWTQLNADRSPTSVFIAINNAACAFTRVKQFSIAEQLFHVLLDRDRTLNAYGEALFLLSCWKNRHNKNEILNQLTACKKITPEKLKKFAPELIDIVQQTSGFCGQTAE